MASSIALKSTFLRAVAKNARPSTVGLKAKPVPMCKPKMTAPNRANLAVRAVSAPSSRPGESPEQTFSRREEESTLVDSRAVAISTHEELDAFLADAEDKLVMLSIESDDECDLGDNPDAWTIRADAADGTHTPTAPCVKLKSNLARVARQADNVVFLTLEVNSGDDTASELAQELGVTRFPTFQYYKHGDLVWEHIGAGPDAAQNMGEGVLYYGGQGPEIQVDDYIYPVKSEDDFEIFKELCAAPQKSPLGVDIKVECEKQLAILDVSCEQDSPGCLHVFPAVVALARNTAGATRWARLLGDSSPEATALMNKFNITAVPTFVFFVDGVEAGRYTGSDRMELMNNVLKFQAENGVKLPQRAPRKRMSTKEAKEIAKKKREDQKKVQWNGPQYS